MVQTKRFFFIPFKGETLYTYVVCQTCERTMSEEDLRGRMSSDTKTLLNGIQHSLRSGTPIEEAVAALTKEGMSEVEARRFVNAAAGIILKKCRQCALTYLDTVCSCRKCGHMLPGI